MAKRLTKTDEFAGLSADMLRTMYRRMCEIRHFEERALELYRAGQIKGSIHACIGMEAISVGAMSALRPDDLILSSHRGHGDCIAKGARLDLMMAELCAKATGYCRGRGGTMHIADPSIGLLGTNGVVGAGIGLATGAALAVKIRGSGQVAVAFFGDGGLNQGVLLEAGNLASLWRLPVIFVCENNEYAFSAPVRASIALANPADRAVGLGMPGISIDGMDPITVYKAMTDAVERARGGGGPSLLICNAYRFEGHNVGDPQLYRTKDEVEMWRARDPIILLRSRLIHMGVLVEDELLQIDQAAQRAVDSAAVFALESADPDPQGFAEGVYA